MITMRIGKQGIPLWFHCFKDNNDTEAFKLKLMQDGISYVSSLFDKDFNLIFLGDRWFNSTKLMEHIDSLGHTYNLRLKSNINVYHHDKKENHKIRKTVGQLPKKKYHSVYYKKIRILSLFNTGLTLFNRAFESLRYIRIPYSFILYDS